jgi:hypothetical protein
MLSRKLERELNAGIDRIRLLIAERDTARLQADQKVSLREEFRELLGTDDIEQGITVVCDLKQIAAVRLAYIKQLESNNDAANAEIERLTNKVAQLYRGAEEQNQRIKRLEQENEAMRVGLLLWREDKWRE